MRGNGPGRPVSIASELWLAGVLGAAVAVGAWAWAAGEVAAWLASRRWLPIPVSSLPGVLPLTMKLASKRAKNAAPVSMARRVHLFIATSSGDAGRGDHTSPCGRRRRRYHPAP